MGAEVRLLGEKYVLVTITIRYVCLSHLVSYLKQTQFLAADLTFLYVLCLLSSVGCADFQKFRIKISYIHPKCSEMSEAMGFTIDSPVQRLNNDIHPIIYSHACDNRLSRE